LNVVGYKGKVDMSRNRFTLNARAALLVAIASACPVIGYSAPAAQVDFAVGNVTAVGSNGQSRALGKGAQIEQGDTVNTNGGRVQLRFTDGAYVSLQPQSQFRIDQYRFDGKQDGNEKGFFSLLKGGLRTITGLVGRSNKANYQVSTAVATIGIRGTEYTIQYGKSVTGTVGEGEINVCNGAGCLSVTNGESYYVQNQEVKPVLTNKRTDLPPPEPANPPSNFTQGNNTDAGGNPLPGFVLTGTYVSPTLAGAYAYNGDGVLLNTAGQATFDASGRLIQLDGVTPAAPVTNGGNDGIVAWGTFVDTSSFPTTYAYVVGLPTPMSDIGSLAAANLTGTYELTGKTAVFDGSGSTVGTLDSATLTAKFGAASATAGGAALSSTLNWTWDAKASVVGPASATLTGTTSTAALNLSGSCGANCYMSASGSFFGPNAIRAGFAYQANSQWGGAAVLTQTSLK
jgi:hypothetical protein